MILDSLLQFSSAQSLAIAIGTAPSTNVIDFGLGTAASPAIPSDANGGGARDMGIGDDPALKLLVQISTAATSGGAGTLAISLQGAPDDGTGAPGTFVSWWTSPAYTLAQMAAGARLLDIDFPRPPQGAPIPRFVRLLYTVAGANLTGGAIQSYVVLDRDDQPYLGTDNSIIGGYPAGINIAN